ncbi:hypothetical protein TrLO_g2798 [Triparma laevis f. longispina]|uniref:Uncharacterized protein n=1 Tax=Triparma laevis f. longispina TaxID=1714387 RepID=A0A9W7FRZ4_9STRA|nr:hypothetical protein TrLO_g2798 [Triparma laevis f. longispina]
MCDAACSGNPCPIGTTYEETCKSIGWFSSWWFWRWGGYEHEDWCALPSSSIPSSAIDVTRTNVLYGSIPASCLAFDCTGDVFSAASCNTLGSGWNEESVTTECGREAGFGTTASRPCAQFNGYDYYAAYYMNSDKDCVQISDSSKIIPGLSNVDPNLVDGAPKMLVNGAPPNMKTQSIGAGASLAVAPAAVIGLFFMKNKMKKKQKEETPLVGNENL